MSRKSIVLSLLSILAACQKPDDPEPQRAQLRYEVTCVSCSARYIMNGHEYHTQVSGSWQNTHWYGNTLFPTIHVHEPDSIGTVTAKIFVDDVLRASGTNVGNIGDHFVTVVL